MQRGVGSKLRRNPSHSVKKRAVREWRQKDNIDISLEKKSPPTSKDKN